ncbi:hypothetical protein AGMMS49938_18750 [Fibrobacterales bacterium]|nr:hypothetical protein AGMMS49938_18750 [Fibrobacterales bacterium]
MRTYGVFGDILCKPLTHDFSRYSKLKKVLLEFPSGKLKESLRGNLKELPNNIRDNIKEAEITQAETYGELWKFRFAGYPTPETASALTNSYILIPKDERLPAPEGQFYFSDFEEGFVAINNEGKIIGKVLSASEMPSVNVFNLQIGEGAAVREVIVPWIDDCILNINLKDKKILVNEEYIESL